MTFFSTQRLYFTNIDLGQVKFCTHPFEHFFICCVHRPCTHFVNNPSFVNRHTDGITWIQFDIKICICV